jgi:hypothetical protein
MPTSNKPSGRTAPTPAGIEAELTRLQQRVGELRRVQAMSRRITLILALIVVGEFAIFVYYTKQHLQANFNQQDVQRAVEARVPQVTPELQQRILAVAQNVYPIYRDQATERFHKVGPEVAKDAVDRLQKFPHENGEELNSRLKIAFDKALSRVEPDLKKSFPMLTEEQQTKILHERFVGAIDKENDEVGHHVNEMAENEMNNMQQILKKFDLPADASDAASRTREREFLHALVDVMMDGEMTFKAPPAPSTRPASPPPAQQASAAPTSPLPAPSN